MTKRHTAAAVASALAAPAAMAAIDDQGMQYVTAGEGLGGSLRVDVLLSTSSDRHAYFPNGDGGGSSIVSKGNSIRLWVAGDSDLGGGLSSTYYVEFRDNMDGNADDGGNLYTDAFDIGLRGGFGSFSVGLLGMVAPRMVPSADLAFERGSKRESFAADPGANGIRYESPVINGFQFGASGVVNEAGGPSGTLDEYSLAARYQVRSDIVFGVGYESRKNDTYGLYEFSILDTTANPIEELGGDDSAGFRFGARYTLNNVLFAYEYRGYDGWADGFQPAGAEFDDFSGDYRNVSVAGVTDADGNVALPIYAQVADFARHGFPGLSYEVHAVGVQGTFGKVVASANYSTEANDVDLADPAAAGVSGSIETDRDTLALDVAYRLGSRSTVAVGYRETDIAQTHTDLQLAQRSASETYVFYRVDF